MLVGRCEQKYLLGDLGVNGRILLYTVRMLTSAVSSVRCTRSRSGARTAQPMLSNTRAAVGTSEQSAPSLSQKIAFGTRKERGFGGHVTVWRLSASQEVFRCSSLAEQLSENLQHYDRYLGNFSRDVKPFLL